MKVYNLTSPRGTVVPNQFEIQHDGKRYFQSYRSIIAVIDERGNVTLDSYYWDYSRTTSTYRNIFLGMTTKETKQAIERGEITLANLN